jgi:hypothetical protein
VLTSSVKLCLLLLNYIAIKAADGDVFTKNFYCYVMQAIDFPQHSDRKTVNEQL